MTDVDRVRELLAGTNPVPPQMLQGADLLPEGRRALQAILDSHRDPTLEVPGIVDQAYRRTRRRYSVLAVAAAASVVLALTAVVQPWGPTPGAVADTPPLLRYDLTAVSGFADAVGDEAGPLLGTLASAALTRTDPPRTGDIQYVRSVGWALRLAVEPTGTSASLRPNSIDTWTRPDRSVSRVTSTGKPLALDGTVQVAQDAPVVVGQPERETFRPNAQRRATPASLQGLTGQDLLDELATGTACLDGPVTAVCLLDGVSLLHQDTIIPGSVDAAVWAALADAPDLVSLGRVTDRLGRAAVAVTVASDVQVPVRHVLLIDPATGALTGSEDIVLSDDPAFGVTPPAVIGFQAIVSAAWTDATPF
ncbi:hypothetical protein [Cellulomonas hominis]